MIDSSLQQQLREQFNPDGSMLRQQQMRMLEMLIWFDRLCKKHDIPYWLSSGTLLGAVRHGGYIPWDDDVDIDMMREDYDRLKTIMLNMDDPDYQLQDNESDDGYFFSYGKLRDKHSYLEETNHYDRIFNMRGMYLDIITFERMPRCFNKIACMSVGHSYKILNRQGISDSVAKKKVQRIYAFNHRFLFPVLRFVASLFPGELLHRSPGIPYKSRTMRNEIFPLTTIEFEGHSFSAPHDTHSYLTRMFGDYMQLPDTSKIAVHTLTVRIDK